MAFTVTKENLADPGRPVFESTDIDTGRGRVEIRNDHSREQNASIQVSAHPGDNIDNMFFDKDSVRIKGSAPHGESHFNITQREQIEAMAKNLQIPASDISQVSYTMTNNKVVEMGVTYRDGIDAADVGKHNKSITLAMEQNGNLPRGSTYKMGQESVFETGSMRVTTRQRPDGAERILEINVGADNNSTGHAFTMKEMKNGSTEISFGHNDPIDSRRSVSQDEFKAAQNMADRVGGRVSGEPGKTMHGVTVTLDKPAHEVMASLEQAKFVAPGVTEALGQPVSDTATHPAPKNTDPIILKDAPPMTTQDRQMAEMQARNAAISKGPIVGGSQQAAQLQQRAHLPNADQVSAQMAQQAQQQSRQPTIMDKPPPQTPNVEAPRVELGSASAPSHSVGGHAMNVLGAVPIALSMAHDVKSGHGDRAAATAVTFTAAAAAPSAIAHIVPSTLSKVAPLARIAPVAGVVSEKAIPIAGGVVGAAAGINEARHDFASGHQARGWLDSIKASAYGTSAVAGGVVVAGGLTTAADCWNPTVVVPAAVTAGAAVVEGGSLAVGASIDAAEAVHDHLKGIEKFVTGGNTSAAPPTRTARGNVPSQPQHTETPVDPHAGEQIVGRTGRGFVYAPVKTAPTAASPLPSPHDLSRVASRGATAGARAQLSTLHQTAAEATKAPPPPPPARVESKATLAPADKRGPLRQTMMPH